MLVDDWRRDELSSALEQIAGSAGVDPVGLTAYVAIRLVRDPSLFELPSMLAVESTLRRLVMLGPVAGVALWTHSTTAPPARPIRVVRANS